MSPSKSKLLTSLCVFVGMWSGLSVAHGSDSSNDSSSDLVVKAPAAPVPQASYLSPWLNQTLYQYLQLDTKNGRTPITGEYLEYEFAGSNGPLELYGYVDISKDFNIGNQYAHGPWDGGSNAFIEVEPRLSIGKTLGRNLAVGPFKDWFVAFDYTYDAGQHGAQTQSLFLYNGLGTTVDLGLPLRLQVNLYARYVGDNYALKNTNQWDGYRLQFVYYYPIMQFSNGATLGYSGYTNLDFASRLHELMNSASLTDHALKSTHGLIYRTERYSVGITAQYFEDGGQNRGSTGWAGLAKAGLRF